MQKEIDEHRKKRTREELFEDNQVEDEVSIEDNPHALEKNQVQIDPENNAEIQDNPQTLEDNIVQSEGNPRRKPRGPTKVRRLPFNSLEQIEVQFNTAGEPIGSGSVKLSSYLGPLVREIVPVTLSNWKQLSTELKDVLWESIQVTLSFALRLNLILIAYLKHFTPNFDCRRQGLNWI